MTAQHFNFQSFLFFDGAGMHLRKDKAQKDAVNVFEELELFKGAIQMGQSEIDSKGNFIRNQPFNLFFRFGVFLLYFLQF